MLAVASLDSARAEEHVAVWQAEVEAAASQELQAAKKAARNKAKSAAKALKKGKKGKKRRGR